MIQDIFMVFLVLSAGAVIVGVVGWLIEKIFGWKGTDGY